MRKEGKNTQQLGRSITPWSAVPASGSVVEGLKDSERVGAVSFDVKTLSNKEGNKIGGDVSYKKLRLIERSRGMIQEVRSAIPLRPEGRSLLAQF